MTRNATIVIILVVSLVCAGEQQLPPALDESDYRLLSLAVSEVIVEPRLPDQSNQIRQVVFITRTSLGMPPGAAAMTQMGDGESTKIRQEASDLVKSLLEINKEHLTLDVARIDVHLKVTAISDQEVKEIFEGKGQWQEFYKRYPNSQGVSVLSRVAYNAEKTQALLYVGTMSNMLAGEGELVLFEKQGSDWKIKHHGIVWVS